MAICFDQCFNKPPSENYNQNVNKQYCVRWNCLYHKNEAKYMPVRNQSPIMFVYTYFYGLIYE